MSTFVPTKAALATIIGLGAASLAPITLATEPCGDLGECKALVEINSTDGDVGFHFLMDGDEFIRASIYDPREKRIFRYITRRDLRRQTLTEVFAESAEPLCWFDPEADPEDLEDVVTLERFLRRWDAGTYQFVGIDDEWELSFGASELTFALPAAPIDIEYEEEDFRDDDGDLETIGEISWERGNDLGNCAEVPDADDGDDPNVPNLADVMHLLDEDPENVPVAVWEVVVEIDLDDDDPNSTLGLKHVTRIPGDAELEVELPPDYLETLPDNTPIKIEIGAIGFDDNATFTEVDEICVNEDDSNPNDELDGCGFDVDGDDD